MTNKIVLSQGTTGMWACKINSDNGKGDFSEILVGRSMDRTDLLENAVAKLGIELTYIVQGKEI